MLPPRADDLVNAFSWGLRLLELEYSLAALSSKHFQYVIYHHLSKSRCNASQSAEEMVLQAKLHEGNEGWI